MQKIGERAEVAARRAIENEAAADFPVTDERIKITGTVSVASRVGNVFDRL
jgi:hypothetical protein